MMFAYVFLFVVGTLAARMIVKQNRRPVPVRARR
ncbi:hypothetical protein AWB82_00120 [Caballeronia glebae]|jgi:hypothetical protein|uniref:Uncharacterized protein n=1 Tax=Caballeronia glebae TaxID=1777143 RepID=A0A157Z295_9BURK|nr:hypothetical protein AWB82_00120 [Caballeronia glebae]